MPNDIRRAEKGTSTIYLNVGMGYKAETEHIHLTLPRPDWFHTTVLADRASKRGHPNLYEKLARALREAGAPAPVVGKH